MRRTAIVLAGACILAACDTAGGGNEITPVDTNGAAAGAAELSLARLDCGSPTIKNFDSFFSDKPGLYEAAPRDITDSCYLIRNGDQVMIWDTGFPAALKGSEQDMGQLVARLDKTIAEQLAQVNLTPADVDVVGISHMHGDHTGQAKEFPAARLLIGEADFEQSAGAEDPFGPWRGDGKAVTLATGDVDVFGDGKVMALHLPGHTPNHLALLVNLASGPVLLSGDLYHSTLAREKRTMPGFNTDKAQTLASMDKFEALAKEKGAKVVIQHEADDIAKLPAFPKAAE